jgi:hypothetical protein
MKYVILRGETSVAPLVIVFDESLVHRGIARGAVWRNPDLVPVSAGFCSPHFSGWKVDPDRRSESLNLGPAPGDGLLLTLAMRYGLTGSDLDNAMTLAALGKQDLLADLLRRCLGAPDSLHTEAVQPGTPGGDPAR